MTGTLLTPQGLVACVSCVLTQAAARGAVPEQHPRRLMLDGGASAPDEVAHADRVEAIFVAAYRARFAFVDGVREAVQRAEVMARLDAALHRMCTEQRKVA